MKLHLPSALRKALLACLAAISLPVALPTTLGTASGIAAVGFISAQRVAAEDVTITSKRGDNSYNSALESKNAAGNKWIFDVPTMDFNFGIENPAELKSPTHEADFEFRQTLTVNNGFNNVTNTFNGAFTGGAGADLLFASWNNNVTNTWVFNGDLSQFQGSIRCTTDPAKPNVTQGILNVEFAEGAKTNTGAIKQEGTGTLNLTITGQSMENSEISVNNFTLNGAVSLSDHTQVTVAGVTTFGNGTVLTINEGGSLTLGGGITLPSEWKINLVTENTNYGDPGWSFDGGIDGLSVGDMAKVTINGQSVEELAPGKKLDFRNGQLVLVDSSQSGGDTGTADATIASTAEYKAAAGDATKNAAGKTWNVNVDDTGEGYSFWFQGSPGNAGNWDSVTEANLHLLRTLTVGFNGSSDKTQTFNGAITGEAGANLVFQWDGHTNTWQFNGDLSGFSGDILSKAGTIKVVFGEGAKTNTGAIKQDGGTLDLTLNGQVISNGDISVNNFTLNGDVSFSAGANVTVTGTMASEGSVVLTINEGGLLRLANPTALPGGITINLVTDNMNFEDTGAWYFDGGISGLDSASMARVTINGQLVEELAPGMVLEFAGGRLVLVDGSQQGGTTDTFGPRVTWSDPVVMGGDTVLEGNEDNLNYKIADSAKVTGGAAGMSLRLQKTGTGNGSYDGCHLAGDGGDAAAALTLENLYLTADPNEITGDGDKQLYFDIKVANYLSAVQDVWIKNVGLIIQADMNLTTNFHLGSNDHEKSGGWFNDPLYRIFTLCLQNDLTTTGTLEVVEDARIVFDQVHTLTVGSLTGEGDLSLSVVGGDAAALAITGNSDTYSGHLTFAQSGNHDTTVKLGDGVTLSTAGIRTTGDHLGGRFEMLEGGTATVEVTGDNLKVTEDNPNPELDAALGVTFGEGVTLRLAEGASQAFGHSLKADQDGHPLNPSEVIDTEISRLTGEGTLGVVGNVTVKALADYTGEVHLYGNSTGGNSTGERTVLQLGGTTGTGGGTLSRVVLRQGGGELRLGQGAWGLSALGVLQDASGAETGSRSRLRIGAVEGADRVTLNLGGGEGGGLALGENVELTLGGGVDYSGTIVVDASAGATGARLFEVEDAGLLDGLTLKVVLSGEDFSEGEGWGGLQLFARGLKRRMKDALLGAIDVEGGSMDGLALDITDDGLLCFVRQAISLVWGAPEGGVWEEGGTTQWDIAGGGGESTFQGGDTVFFGVIGGEGKQTVQVRGAVAPKTMTIDGADYTFNAEEGGADAAIDVGGDMTIGAGASATFNGALSLSAGVTHVIGELHLNTDGGLSLGSAEVAAGGIIYLESGGAVTAGNWDRDTIGGGTMISGDGKVVLRADATGDRAVDGEGNLFTKLFAGGDAGVERDAEHAGIDTFEVEGVEVGGEKRGVTLELGDVGKSMSLIRNMHLQAGNTLVVRGRAFDNAYSGYQQTGTLTLSGEGVPSGGEGEAPTPDAEEGRGALVFEGGNNAFTWDIVLEGDALIANRGEGEVSFTGGAELDAGGHTVTFAGGAFRLGGGETGGFYAAEGSKGTLALADNTSLGFYTDQRESYSEYDLELVGEGASFTTQSDAMFRNVRGNGRVTVESGKVLILGGSVRGTETQEGEETTERTAPDVVLHGGSSLAIRGNAGTEASEISSLILLDGDAAMELTLGDNAVNGVLEIGKVVNSAYSLTLTLDGLQNYIDAHRNDEGWNWTIQLFTGDAVEQLYTMWETGKTLQLGGVIGYEWKLDEKGVISLTEITDVYTWTDTKHGSAHRLTWKDGMVGGETGKWDGGVSYKNGVIVELVGDTGEGVTVSISGRVEAKEVRITGSSAFTFERASEGGDLHAVDIDVETDSTFNPKTTLYRRLTVQAGKAATFSGGLMVANGSEIVLDGGATVRLVGDNMLEAAIGGTAEVTGSGNWDVDLSGGSGQTYDGTGVTLAEGVKMHLTGVAGEEDVWSNVSNLNTRGELELTAGKQVVFTGVNNVGALTAVFSNSADAVSVEHVVLEGSGSTLNITGEGDTDIGHVVLDIRSGTFTQTGGTLTVGGLRSNAQDEGTLRVKNLAITADDKWDIYDAENTGGQRGYSGSLVVEGDMTMNGKLWEEGNGGDTGNGGDAVDPGGDAGGDLGDAGGNPGDEGGDLGDVGGNPGDEGGDLGDVGGNPGDEGGDLGDVGGNPGDEGGDLGDVGGNPGDEGGDLGDVGGEPGDVGGGVVDDDYVQHLDGEVSVGGAAMVQSGVLDVGSKKFTVGGQLGVSGGQFKWHGEEMTVGSLSITGDGAVELTAGEITVNGGISGDGGTLDISGAPKEGAENEVENVKVTLKGEESATYAGEVKLGRGGTLAVESTGQELSQMTAMGGSLSVGDRMNLTVGVLNGAVPNPGLTNVTLGAGANLTVHNGSFTLTGTLTWGAGASITLDYSGEGDAPKVLLGGGFNFGEENKLTGKDKPLTFNLSAEYLASLTLVESEDGKIKAHFLDNGRDGSSGWKEKVGDGDDMWMKDFFQVLASDDPWNYANLELTVDGYLTWDAKDGATWIESSDGVAGLWTDTPSADQTLGRWVDVQSQKRLKDLKDVNIYLTREGVGDDGRAELKVEGTVNPRSVYVEGGVYTLTQKEGTEGGLQVGGETGKGLLVVLEGAELNMNLANKRLPQVIVEGTLGLGHVAALPGGTELRLNKEGTLRYTEPGATQDVSGMVSAESKSEALHVEVGKRVGAEGVTWGTAETNPATNNGLKLALDSGTVKSGDGNLTLKWTDASADAATHAGKQEVRAGRLILEAGGKTVLSGEVVTEEGASLVLKATDALTYSGTATGGGALEVAQGAVTLSGNNTTGGVTLTGGTAILGSDGALGNENTVLTLSGGNIQAGSHGKVGAGRVEVVQGQETAITAGDVEIAGTVTGRGTLKVEGKAKGTLSGDVSGFMGTLDTGTSTWTLSRAGGETGARVAGQGKVVVNAKDAITLTGDVGTGETDRVTLQNSGSGDLVIATGRIGSGTQLQASKGNIVLGNADNHIELGNGAADWAFGAITGEGSLVLSNVTLPHGDVFGKVAGTMKLVVSTATAPEPTEDTPQAIAAEAQGGHVDVAGMDVGKLDGITVNEHGLFTGATGEYTVSKEKGLGLHFTAENWTAGTDMSGLQYLISGQGAATEGTPDAQTEPALSIHQGNGEGLQLAFDASILVALREDETAFHVRVLDGETATWDVTADGSALYNALQNSDDQVANALAMAWDGGGVNGFTKDGFVLSVQLQNLYLVTASGGDKHESTSPLDMMSKKATVVLDGQTLTLNWAEDGVVRNLMGTKGVGLDIHRNAADASSNARLNVSFDNTYYQDVNDERGEGHLSSENWIAVKGQDTTFDGTISGAEGVDITKTGLGTLTVGGNYTLADGTTRLERGRMVLSGAVNSMKTLEFAYTESSDPGKDENNNDAEERGLVLDGGHTTLESIVDAGSVGNGAGVVLQGGAELSLSGASSLEYTAFTGGEGSGTITLESSENSGGSLVLSGGASISGVAVKLNGRSTVLDVGSGENNLSALNGNGVLRGAPDGNLSVGGGEFSGTLDATPGGSVTKGGRLTVVEGATFTLKNASSAAKDMADGWDVDVKQGGSLTLDLTGKTASTPLVFGDVSVAGDLSMSLDANLGGAPVKGSLSLTDTATFTVYGTGKIGDSFSLGFSTNMNLDLLKEKLRLEGTAFVLDEIEDVTLAADGTIVIRTRLAKDTLEKKLSGVHGNAHAGFSMLLDALQNQSGAFANPTSYFSEMVLTLFDNIKKGEMAGVDRSLAAIAGSSISTLGSAVSQDMHRQLTSIRNRTTTMAAEVTPQSYAMLPLWHAWINGESDYHKLDADSFAPGFTLNSWGGTIGVDVDVAPHATVGLAVTAMYGDLKTEDAPDTADGSVDSVYVSTFLRATSGAWVHSLVLSAGAADISLDRRVNYGAYSYRTSGSTNGYSLGALYEVGYSRIVNKSGTIAVQPVFNVELRHIGIDGYTETGSDGALQVDDMDQTVVTFGAGARMQAAVGTNAFNRTAVFESRLLVKADAGDRSGSATTGLKGSNASAEVESAEVGVLGVEAGAGISVPLGRNYGSLFLDGSLEFRDGWTSANGTLGYRIDF